MNKPFKVNPFVNGLMRLTGEWPLSGPPPLSEKEYRQLFDSTPAFVDYFPIVDYDYDNEVYIFDDYINVAKIYEVTTSYMGAKSENALDSFNASVTQAINSLPVEDEAPYVCQIFVKEHETSNFGDYLASKISPEIREQPFTQKIIDVMREHSELLSHKNGIFKEDRLPKNKGWRLNDLKVILVVYRKRPENYWKKALKSPVKQLQHDLSAFNTAMDGLDLTLRPFLPSEFINWLSPLFGKPKRFTEASYKNLTELANHDLGQQIIDVQARYHHTEDETQRGIWRFGDTWSRYLTFGGINHTPRSGAVSLGKQETKGSRVELTASLLERLPPGSMMTYTIIPQSDAQMKNEINLIKGLAEDGGSREAKYTTEQAEQVNEAMLRYHEKVFYAQMGLYVVADDLDTLLNYTEVAISEVKATSVFEVITPKWDLISQDSYIRALPAVYDWAHDRRSAERARKCYASHLASLLPFFGNKSGSKNPCYVMFTRTGEPFYMNPFHPEDKERVAHELFFGPTGSGKSATICYMSSMSIAVNNPRTFLFDYGNSFKLLGDFAETYGKKVKRIDFSMGSTDVVAPFFETQKALHEAEQAQQISEGTWIKPPDDDSYEDEKRSYLAEMEYILRIMITGGSKREDELLRQPDLARISEALVRGLKLSVEQGERHARPIHMATAMRQMSEEEAKNGIIDIAKAMRDMSDAIMLWTKGLRGSLFNRIAEGFDPDYDLTIIEIGNLGKSGGQDMMAVAGLSAIYTITAMGEKFQNSGRAIEMKIDEAHVWAQIPMLMGGLIVGAKAFRKLQIWLSIITQDISDFTGEATKILTNAEFWWLMRMSPKEIKEACEILELDEEVQHLIKFPRKEPGKYVEGVSISAKYPDTLIRYVPPALMLALGQTDGDEKERRQQIMNERHCSELEAVYIIADEITASRREFQQNTVGV